MARMQTAREGGLRPWLSRSAPSGTGVSPELIVAQPHALCTPAIKKESRKKTHPLEASHGLMERERWRPPHRRGTPRPVSCCTRRSGSSSRAPERQRPSSGLRGGHARGSFWRHQGRGRPLPVQAPGDQRAAGPRPLRVGGGRPRQVSRRADQNSERPPPPGSSCGPGAGPVRDAHDARDLDTHLTILPHAWRYNLLEKVSVPRADSAFALDRGRTPLTSGGVHGRRRSHGRTPTGCRHGQHRGLPVRRLLLL